MGETVCIYLIGIDIQIYKELRQFNGRKTYKPIKTLIEDLDRQFSKEDIKVANGYMKRCSTFTNHQGNKHQNHSEISPHSG